MGSRDSIPWTNYIGIGYVACQRLNMLGAARLFCMESMRRSEELKEMRESAIFLFFHYQTLKPTSMRLSERIMTWQRLSTQLILIFKFPNSRVCCDS
jgi:hypothetical protein